MLVGTSQPSAALALQSAYPGLHLIEQTPLEHAGVPPTVLQLCPQPPQLSTSVAEFDSQPSAAVPLQLLKPVVQVPGWHWPALQTPMALAGAQVLPQPPQFAVLAAMSCSQPLLGMPSQSAQAVAGSQVGWQTPVVHLVCPCEFVHCCPHAPQSDPVPFRSVSQPSR